MVIVEVCPEVPQLGACLPTAWVAYWVASVDSCIGCPSAVPGVLGLDVGIRSIRFVLWNIVRGSEKMWRHGHGWIEVGSEGRVWPLSDGDGRGCLVMVEVVSRRVVSLKVVQDGRLEG